MATSFRVAVLREVIGALEKVYTIDYPDPLLRNLHIGLEYQDVKEKFPSIVITFLERMLQRAGLGHLNPKEFETGEQIVNRWIFQGGITFTLLALTTFDRDLLADSLLDVMAFGKQSERNVIFHDDIEDNDWIPISLMTDHALPGGNTTTPSPWGNTNEQLYQTSYTFDCFGQFFSDPATGDLVRLSQINTFPFRPDQAVPIGTTDPSPWL